MGTGGSAAKAARSGSRGGWAFPLPPADFTADQLRAGIERQLRCSAAARGQGVAAAASAGGGGGGAERWAGGQAGWLLHRRALGAALSLGVAARGAAWA